MEKSIENIIEEIKKINEDIEQQLLLKASVDLGMLKKLREDSMTLYVELNQITTKTNNSISNVYLNPEVNKLVSNMMKLKDELQRPRIFTGIDTSIFGCEAPAVPETGDYEIHGNGEIERTAGKAR